MAFWQELWSNFRKDFSQWIPDFNADDEPIMIYNTDFYDKQGNPKATPKPEDSLEERITRGLKKYGGEDIPMATKSAELAEAGERISENTKADPLLPAIISLIEGSGLSLKGKTGDVKQGIMNMRRTNNPFNVMYKGERIKYPNLNTAILGKGELDKAPRGFVGTLREGGRYQEYLESGKEEDFFKHYTPSTDPRNPVNEELVRRYDKLREYFE